jgi:hypothetical protein
LKKEVEPIIKDQDKKCYSEPGERISETEDYKCGAQAIYYHFNIDEPCASVETKVRSIILNGRQSQVVEITPLSVDGKICLYSEINIKFLIEEANHFNGFREVFSISSIIGMKQKLFKQRRSEAKDLKRNAKALENNPHR